MNRKEIERIFTFKTLEEHQREKIQILYSHAMLLGLTINALCQECEEKDIAIRCLQDATKWADTAIALETGPREE